jgi:hypothetical protein
VICDTARSKGQDDFKHRNIKRSSIKVEHVDEFWLQDVMVQMILVAASGRRIGIIEEGLGIA